VEGSEIAPLSYLRLLNKDLISYDKKLCQKAVFTHIELLPLFIVSDLPRRAHA